MKRQKLGKKNFLEVAVAIAIAMTFIMPVSSMVATFESGSIPADTIITVEPTIQTVKKGETFTVSIYVVPIEPVICINVGNLSFNSSLIHANAVTEGDLFDPYETFTPGSIDNIAGNIAGIEGDATPSNATNDTGILCNISFTAQEEIGTSVLDIENAVVTNLSGSAISSTINDGSVTVVAWLVVLKFSEMGGIREDVVVFAEMPDANDGPPADIYDSGKPSPPFPPYLYIWFDDNLPAPNNFLCKDYRSYPDTEKVWDLYAKWDNDDTTPPDITISWNTSGFMWCEYDSVILMWRNDFNNTWDFVADMLVSNNYVYAPRYFSGMWLTDHFQINASDMTPPVISDVIMTTSDPLDTDAPYGWENVTCNVVDDGAGVNQVKLIVTDPDENIIGYTITNIPDTDAYYYNTTFTIAGCYSYHIWADDINGNAAESPSEQFELPPNWDVSENGRGYLEDFVMVAGKYGDVGPPGWIREDVSNNGKIYLEDFVIIAGHYGEEWERCS